MPASQTSHARALLDALLAKPSGLTVASAARRSSNGGGGAVASTAATAAVAAAAAASPYRPQKPSSLASSSSANNRDDEEEEQRAALHQDKDATPEPTPMSTSLNTGGAGTIAHILQLLDDEAADEEERIENVRSAFGDALEEVEGSRASPSRLDGLVLELLHRHREDVRPTGATFAPLPNATSAVPAGSPRRRPPSLRSFSNSATPHPHTSRPWTPTAAAAAGAAVTPPPSCAAPRTPTSVAAGLPIGSPLPSPGLVGPGWGDSSSDTISPRGSEFPGSIGSGWPSPTPLSASAQAYGVIGSGSPRASPRLWHRPSSLLAGAKEGSASGPATATPWSSALGLPPSPSYSHSSAAPGGLLAASLSANSRPASPSPLGSPRLNVGASEFMPRIPPPASASPAASASGRPESWLSATGSARRPSSTAAGTGLVRSPSQLGAYSTSSASGNGGSSIGEASSSGEEGKSGSDTDEADEFSPFAALSEPASSTAPTSTRPSSGSTALNTAPSMLGDEWYGSSNSASSASGSYGAYDASPLAMMGDEESAMMSMTPFDVLCSIVNAPTSNAASSSAGSNSSSGLSSSPPTWSAEQIEDALAANGWDVDATLAAIMDSGGVPPTRVPSGPRSSTSPGTTNAVAQPRFTAGRSGVSLMPREAFVSHRMASASPATAARTSFAARGASPGSTAAQLQQPASPRDQVGPARTCRYYLAGECRRADCRFSHDLGRALCRFWLRGQCLNNPCTFLHDSDVVQALATGIASTSVSSSGSGAASSIEPQTPPSEDLDFPELGLVAPTGPKGAKKVPGAPSGPAASDPSRTRWAAALQRSKASTPLALVASGEAAIPIHARGAPTRAPPSGPKALAQPVVAASTPRASSRIPLRAPVLMPTLATGAQASAAYIAHRNGALLLSEQRNKCFARAGEAWKAGDGATARQWSAEGQKLNAQLVEESKVAAGAIVRERHAALRDRLLDDSAGAARGSEEPGARGLRGKLMGASLGICLGVASRREVTALHAAHAGGSSGSVEERTECLLDLHGLHAEEAVGVAEEFLMGLERESFRGLAYLACGIGLHTSTSTDKRRVGLKKAVKSWLDSWQYPYHEYEGVLAVDPLTHG